MSIVSHLSLTMVPLMIGVVFSQTETLQKAWHRKPSVSPGSASSDTIRQNDGETRLGSANKLSSPTKNGQTRTVGSRDNLR
jgi:hypothetical protein